MLLVQVDSPAGFREVDFALRVKINTAPQAGGVALIEATTVDVPPTDGPWTLSDQCEDDRYRMGSINPSHRSASL